MCLVCAKERYKEQKRQAYANKRRKKGQLATRRLSVGEKKAINLSLWLREYGSNDPLDPTAHIDLG